jgi:hypothetical protein
LFSHYNSFRNAGVRPFGDSPMILPKLKHRDFGLVQRAIHNPATIVEDILACGKTQCRLSLLASLRCKRTWNN